MTALRQPGVRMPDEEPAPATHRRRADAVFDQVVVDLEAPVLQISGERADTLRVPKILTGLFPEILAAWL
jgi:hypothetical protein